LPSTPPSSDSAADPDDAAAVRLIYVNAWPDERFGYNDLPDAAERARVFDRALEAMERLRPDMILIACNTLSVLYGLTAFSRRAAVPMRGIIEAGTELFAGALEADPDSSLVIFGTKTTIESGVHRRMLVERGVAPWRIAAVACHGLAAAIDDDPGGEEARRRLAACAAEACRGDETGVAAGGAEPAARGRGTLYAGLACTHYGWVAEAFQEELEKRSGRRVAVLDPNERLAVTTAVELPDLITSGGGRCSGEMAAVEVISKVALGEAKRRAAAERLEPVSGLTAAALLNYKHQPGLF
jgi:glutamate racemase